LPQLINIRPRGFEIVGLEGRLDLRNEVRDLRWIFGRMRHHRWGLLRRLALRSKHLERKKHDNGRDGNAATDHRRQAFRIELVRAGLVVRSRGACHGARF
jgi:hypothetical protein